jgi:hypothetical protein
MNVQSWGKLWKFDEIWQVDVVCFFEGKKNSQCSSL